MASLLSPDPGYYIWIDVILHLTPRGGLGTREQLRLGVLANAARPFPMLVLDSLWRFTYSGVKDGGVRCQSLQCHAAAIHIPAGFHNGGKPTFINCARSASTT